MVVVSFNLRAAQRSRGRKDRQRMAFFHDADAALCQFGAESRNALGFLDAQTAQNR